MKIFGTVLALFLFLFGNAQSLATEKYSTAVVTADIFAKAKSNDNWKISYLTGKAAQIVFMNITPKTNPNNEIGMETHQFDQVIFVVVGEGKAILNGHSYHTKSGDMIFIPQGTPHNVVNLNKTQPLKIISVYSAMDMPANTSYQKKSDEHE